MDLPTSLPVPTLQPEVVGAELCELKAGPLGLDSPGLPRACLPSQGPASRKGCGQRPQVGPWESSPRLRGKPRGALEAVSQDEVLPERSVVTLGFIVRNICLVSVCIPGTESYNLWHFRSNKDNRGLLLFIKAPSSHTQFC